MSETNQESASPAAPDDTADAVSQVGSPSGDSSNGDTSSLTVVKRSRMAHVRELFAPGTTIGGKYVIEDLLGKGGSGIVVSARHVALSERFAIKVLSIEDEASSEGDFKRRFLQEARVSASLRNEHVVRVVDVATLEDDILYMVMEFVDGVNLSRLLKERGRLPIDEAIEIIVQVCEGLAEAHARGIVHRDIKPTNIQVTTRADGSKLVKILDFGISKLLDNTDSTRTGLLVGSPPFMSPEQLLRSSSVDGRADIWSLGVLLYKMLSGKQPFSGPLTSIVKKVLSGDPPPSIANVCDDIPPALEAAVSRTLQRELSARTPNVAELARDLLVATEAPDVEQRVGLILATLVPEQREGSRQLSASDISMSGAERSQRARGVRRNRVIIAIVTVALLVAGGLLIALGSRSTSGGSDQVPTSEGSATTSAQASAPPPAMKPVVPTVDASARSTTTSMTNAPSRSAPVTAPPPRRTIEPRRNKPPDGKGTPSVTTTPTPPPSVPPQPDRPHTKPSNPFEERQ